MARGRLGEGLDAVEHRVEGDLEGPGVTLDLGQEQAALQGGERGEREVVRVRAGRELAAGVDGPEPVADPGKAALTLLTKAWAAEFGPAGVRRAA